MTAMRAHLPLVAATLFVTAGACATLPACPAKGGPSWLEVTSPHVRLRTDLGEADAREIVQRIEEMRAAMLAVIWPGAPEPAVRTNAVVLRSMREFAVFTRQLRSPPEVWGVRSPDDPFEPIIALAGTDFRSLRVLTHELAHDLGAWYMPIQPAWYAEGLAMFLETIEHDRKSGVFEAGQPPPGIFRSSLSGRFQAASLLDDGFSEGGPDMAAFEARAWLLVHFLINTHPREFDRLSAALEAASSTEEAWLHALPDLPRDRLDAALDDYARHGAYRVVRGHVLARPPPIEARQMTDAEVHVVRAQLLWSSVPGSVADVAGARRELDEALASDPTNVGALSRRVVWFTPPDQLSQFAAAAEGIAGAHPADWLAWLMVELTARSASGRRTALVRALAIDRNQPAVLNDLAALDLAESRFDDALALATRGMSFRQVVWPLAFNAMRAHRALGHCAEASALSQLLKTRGPRETRALVARVASGPDACKPAAAARAAGNAGPSSGAP
jgi:hypothetical protein